ncbi:MAG: carbonic anhydrase family protein, partial [Gammaproteobacteria bacterium]|nr:carbonic anhydrase family protein [Gammaproteobacteria bacterium]
PAENYITGQKYPMEWQLLYKDARGQLVMVAILAETGRSNPEVAKLAARLPGLNQSRSLSDITLNVSNLLPTNRDYYTFEGSLSMPPCTRDVQWYLLKTPISVSLTQLNSFREHFRNNARPLQALNGRKVQTNR